MCVYIYKYETYFEGHSEWEKKRNGNKWHAVVQSLSRVRLFATPWTAACQAPLSSTISQSLLRYMYVVSDANISSSAIPLLLPSIFLSIRIFSNESALGVRWPKYWSFSFRISLSNGCSGLITFGIDWFDLFAVQGTLKNLLQHHSLKISLKILVSIFDLELKLKKITMYSLELIHYSIRSE